MDSVVIEIQQSLDQISGYWGENVGTPMIMKINPDMLPVMTAAVDVDGMSALEITEYVENELIPAFESLEGVASASASGLLKETVIVTLDQIKIDAMNSLIQKDITKISTVKIKTACTAHATVKSSMTILIILTFLFRVT